MNNINLYRFSQQGFEPSYQHYHAKGVEYLLNENILQNCPEHLRHHILNNQKEILPNWQEYTCGVFAFVGNFPDIGTTNHLLNHLNAQQKLSYEWWSAEISEEEYCFQISNGKLWRKSGLKQIKEMRNQEEQEIFIPSQFLNISNVKKLNDNLIKSKKIKY